jgi:hypothetical protein
MTALWPAIERLQRTWLATRHGEAVRVVAVDADAVHLIGAHTGKRRRISRRVIEQAARSTRSGRRGIIAALLRAAREELPDEGSSRDEAGMQS